MFQTILTIAMIIITLLPSAVQACSDVVRVIDGDTIVLEDGTRVRLWGVDAPESKQAFGPESREWLSKAILGKCVNVGRVSTSYNRIVGVVTVPGFTSSVNAMLVSLGYAWDSPKYSGGKFSAHQRLAKRKGHGLWGASRNPTPPWKFRKSAKRR